MECGFQVCTHAIGDRANRLVLDGYEIALKKINQKILQKKIPGNPIKAKDLRLRVEHAQIVTPEDRQRFSDLGIIASMQPTHATR